MPRIVVIGGGISGLTLAYRLEQRLPDAEVLVLERNTRLGGSIQTLERDGFRVESGPNGFLDNKPFVASLCGELGLGDQLLPASEAAGRNRFLMLQGRLRKLPGGLLSFLGSSVIGWRAKLGLFTERFRRNQPAEPSDESIDAFARRRAGNEVADTLADAFVTGIYAGDPKLLSVRACFPRLADLERAHGSVLRGLAQDRKARRARGETLGRPRMWSFAEGLTLLIDTLNRRLRHSALTGVGVRRVLRQGPGWRVEAQGRDAWDADAVVLACPAYVQAELLGDLDAGLATEIAAIPYNRVAVVALGYRTTDVPHSLDGFGYLSPQRDERDVLGVQWCSSIFPGQRAPARMVLLRAMCGGPRRADMVDWDDDQLSAAVHGELRAALGVRAAPVFRHIVRWDRAIPQYHVGHLARVARIEERRLTHPGLTLAGNAYRGVALNDCVEQAGALAERVAAGWADSARSHTRVVPG
jgi:protoporphyrinogen/coproporphyrinogen III oxidase